MSGHRLNPERIRLWLVGSIVAWAIALALGSSDALALVLTASIILIILTLPRPPFLGPHQ